MYKAIQNLRAYHVTYEKGKVYETLPEGYEKCFIRIGDVKIETAENVLQQSENRSKKNGRRSKRTRNDK